MRKRILLVDDEKNIRFVMEKSLARLETYDVEVAGSGPEALSKIAEQHFDLIITDLKLSKDMDGMELMANIRDMGLHPHFILISGFLSEINKAKARGMEVHSYLVKPFPRETLISAVQDVFEESEQTDE